VKATTVTLATATTATTTQSAAAKTRDLLRVFGDEYRDYTARVHRIIPFVKPGSGGAAATGR
jgi:protein-S-isoprenylcysteine O-methyltransferase Ste14